MHFQKCLCRNCLLKTIQARSHSINSINSHSVTYDGTALAATPPHKVVPGCPCDRMHESTPVPGFCHGFARIDFFWKATIIPYHEIGRSGRMSRLPEINRTIARLRAARPASERSSFSSSPSQPIAVCEQQRFMTLQEKAMLKKLELCWRRTRARSTPRTPALVTRRFWSLLAIVSRTG